jgi:hypothetical protein
LAEFFALREDTALPAHVKYYGAKSALSGAGCFSLERFALEIVA